MIDAPELELNVSLVWLIKVFPFLIAIGLMIDRFDIHMTLHAMGIMLAAVIALVSCNAFIRDRRPKILLLTIAFLLLGAEQVMEFLEMFGFMAVVNAPLPFVGIELVHAVSVSAIVFLTAGVLKKT